jgi:hypothetical protein
MKNPNSLSLNVLTFAWPESSIPFYFTENEIEKSRKLHISNYPNNIEALFPGIKADPDRSLYTTFDYKTDEGIPLLLDFSSENKDLLKKYYNNRLYYYFRILKQLLIKPNFINDTEIWLPLHELSNSTWDVFEKYTLKIQFGEVSDFPELLVSYDGRSKILKRSVSSLIEDVEPDLLKWIYYDNTLKRYEKLVENGFDQFEEARPVLNNPMIYALNFKTELPPRGNNYIIHLEKIKGFIDKFLNTPEFQELIPLHSCTLVNIHPALMSTIRAESNQLLFAGNNNQRVPFSGMSDYGPFKPPKWSKIHLFYIFHQEDRQVAMDFHPLLQKGCDNYKGLQQFARISAHVEPNFSIVFSDKSNPLPEIEQQLNQRNFNPDVRYIAIYLSPWPKTSPEQEKRRIYYHVKELLLKHAITSQVVDADKVRLRNGYFHYSLTNIALAMLAKLDGIPWRLNTPVKNELIIGVGAFRQNDTRLNYIGSAFSFDNKGGFNNFEYFLEHETLLLAGSISLAVREFATRNQHIERLIIHFYKTMSRKELEPIEDALNNLGLSIPVFIVHINKTEEKDMVAFDNQSSDLMPYSGTYLNLGRNRYLLFNNTRYPNAIFRSADGYPFPVKLQLQCTQPGLLDENQVVGGLIEQVYQFSRLYYKSVRQQGLPITIKYPEMLAQIAPNFIHEAIPAYGKDNLWFL